MLPQRSKPDFRIVSFKSSFIRIKSYCLIILIHIIPLNNTQLTFPSLFSYLSSTILSSYYCLRKRSNQFPMHFKLFKSSGSSSISVFHILFLNLDFLHLQLELLCNLSWVFFNGCFMFVCCITSSYTCFLFCWFPKVCNQYCCMSVEISSWVVADWLLMLIAFLLEFFVLVEVKCRSLVFLHFQKEKDKGNRILDIVQDKRTRNGEASRFLN